QRIRRPGWNLPKPEPARPCSSQLINRNELEIDAMIRQQSQQTVARVLDGDHSFGPGARLHDQHSTIADLFHELLARRVGRARRVVAAPPPTKRSVPESKRACGRTCTASARAVSSAVRWVCTRSAVTMTVDAGESQVAR